MASSQIGQINIVFGWIWMVLGITSGSVIGLWSFSGPFPTPRGFEDYSSLPRRMTRLAHIAMFALPMISILYGQHIDALPISDQMKTIGAYSFLVCMVGIPLFLLLAALVALPFKYLEVIPVSAGFVALGMMAWGQFLRLS